MKRKYYTAEEDNYIRENYIVKTDKELAKHLGRTLPSIKNRRNILGLILPKKIAEKRKKDSYYKKGQVPHNKGKRMSDDTRAKVSRTWFKKGREPHNTLPEGTVVKRIDNSSGIVYLLKKHKGKLRYLHHLIWEKYNGKIPPGMNIVFKDKNPANIDIENLECISNEEIMKRNSIHRYPDNIRKAMMRLSKINKLINK